MTRAAHRRHGGESSRGLLIGRAAFALVLVAVAILYLGPRIWNLTTTPYRLDRAIVSADKYNPALDKIVDHETVTLTAFSALDSMDASLADVRRTDGSVAKELGVLIGQIRADLRSILRKAEISVGGLVTSLTTLSNRIDQLYAPSKGASDAVADSRKTLQGILDDASVTAARVHSARKSAESSADDLSGKGW